MLFVCVLIISFLSALVLPWWAIIIPSFILGFLFNKNLNVSFWSGFIALSVHWLALSLLLSWKGDHLMATRIAEMLYLKNWVILLVFSTSIGGILGGLATMSGASVRIHIYNFSKK